MDHNIISYIPPLENSYKGNLFLIAL